MGKRTLSGSEIHAHSKNRHEQKQLKEKLEQLSQDEFQSRDSSRIEAQKWRQFLKDNMRNSGLSPMAMRPEQSDDDDDDWFDPSGQGIYVPRSARRHGERQFAQKFQRPWAYTFNSGSHNKVYKELAQAGENSKKTLVSPRVTASSGSSSSSGGNHPRLAQHVPAVTGLERARSAWGRAEKLLSSRKSELPVRPVTSLDSNEHTEYSVLDSNGKGYKLYRQVSTLKSVERVKSAWIPREQNVPGNIDENQKPVIVASNKGDEIPKLARSVTALSGLYKTKDTWICSVCGGGSGPTALEKQFSQVALVYKGLQKAKTALDHFRSQATSPDPGNEDLSTAQDKPQTSGRRCSCKHKTKSSSKGGQTPWNKEFADKGSKPHSKKDRRPQSQTGIVSTNQSINKDSSNTQNASNEQEISPSRNLVKERSRRYGRDETAMIAGAVVKQDDKTPCTPIDSTFFNSDVREMNENRNVTSVLMEIGVGMHDSQNFANSDTKSLSSNPAPYSRIKPEVETTVGNRSSDPSHDTCGQSLSSQMLERESPVDPDDSSGDTKEAAKRFKPLNTDSSVSTNLRNPSITQRHSDQTTTQEDSSGGTLDTEILDTSRSTAINDRYRKNAEPICECHPSEEITGDSEERHYHEEGNTLPIDSLTLTGSVAQNKHTLANQTTSGMATDSAERKRNISQTPRAFTSDSTIDSKERKKKISESTIASTDRNRKISRRMSRQYSEGREEIRKRKMSSESTGNIRKWVDVTRLSRRDTASTDELVVLMRPSRQKWKKQGQRKEENVFYKIARYMLQKQREMRAEKAAAAAAAAGEQPNASSGGQFTATTSNQSQSARSTAGNDHVKRTGFTRGMSTEQIQKRDSSITRANQNESSGKKNSSGNDNHGIADDISTTRNYNNKKLQDINGNITKDEYSNSSNSSSNKNNNNNNWNKQNTSQNVVNNNDDVNRTSDLVTTMTLAENSTATTTSTTANTTTTTSTTAAAENAATSTSNAMTTTSPPINFSNVNVTNGVLDYDSRHLEALSNSKFVEHKGVRIRNYVSPQLRYKTAARDTRKKGVSVRWHASEGAMVTTYQSQETPKMAEVVFPKHARQKALEKMIEDNHNQPINNAAKIADAALRKRIEEFLLSVKPFCPSQKT